MMHTKFRGNRPTGSGKEDLKGFTIHGHGGHLGHVTQMPPTNFPSLYPWRLHTKVGFDWPSGLGEKVFETVDDRRRTYAGAWVYCKLTYEPSVQLSSKQVSPNLTLS